MIAIIITMMMITMMMTNGDDIWMILWVMIICNYKIIIKKQSIYFWQFNDLLCKKMTF